MPIRTDIQILRGIAVVLVVLFHLGIPGFGNGFLGVDIFFVVSGYLMYTLFKPEEGAAAFYARRGRRLLPAYFTTIVATLLVGSLLVLPIEFGQLSEQAIYAAVFASNIGFWLKDSYFSHSEFTPLIHLWSLGVEIQFYLLVPIIIRVIRRYNWALPFGILASLILCLLIIQVNARTSFFMFPARFWEFGIGMMAARLVIGSTPSRLAGAIAMALIPVILLLPMEAESASLLSGHPALPALTASLLTGAVLVYGVSESWFRNPLGRMVKYLGDISYSLYLVHFPIIVLFFYEPFEGIRLGNGAVSTTFLLVPAMILAAMALHYMVEKSGGRFVTWPRLLAASITLILIGKIAPVLHLQKFDERIRNIAGAWDDRAPFRCGKLYRFIHPKGICFFKPAGGSRETVMLIGDSHADAIKTSFIEAAHKQGISVAFAAHNEPLVVPDLDSAWLLNEARAAGAKRIFLHYSSDLDPATIEKARHMAVGNGVEMTLIMPVPVSSNSILGRLYWADRDSKTMPELTLADYKRLNAALIRYLESKPAGLRIVQTLPALCGQGCAVADANWRPYYFDDTHLTLYGAKRLQPLFAEILADGQKMQRVTGTQNKVTE